MKTLSAVALLVSVSACGGKDENCDFGKFHGTYKIHYDLKSGDCIELPDINIYVAANDASLPAGCTLNGEDHSEAACTQDLDETCDDAASNTRVRGVIHMDVASDGSSANGTATLHVTSLNTGAYLCLGTYDITYERQ